MDDDENMELLNFIDNEEENVRKMGVACNDKCDSTFNVVCGVVNLEDEKRNYF